MGGNGMKLIEDKYNINKIGIEIKKLYKKILNN
jgi:hypothetical protein